MEDDHEQRRTKTKTRPRGNQLQGQRHRPTSKGAVETKKKSFSWGTKPWGQKKSFPWVTKPQGQQQRQRPTFKGAVAKKRNDKDDAQPPRLRRTKQASPPDLKLYFIFNFFMYSHFLPRPPGFGLAHPEGRTFTRRRHPRFGNLGRRTITEGLACRRSCGDGNDRRGLWR